MKFQPDGLAGVNVISRHEPGSVWINAAAWPRSVLVPWRGEPLPWPPTHLASLAPMHFEAVLALQPEVVIFGSGARCAFIAPGLYRALIDRRIGVETMDTSAACRTYNVLASEGRSVVAALLLETGA